MREIIIGNKIFKPIASFYRTHGAGNQRYICVDDVCSNDFKYLYFNRMFHVVEFSGTFYFIKKYFSDLDIAEREYEICQSLFVNNIIMDVYDYDNGAILCEYISGTPFSKLSLLGVNEIFMISSTMVNFIESLKQSRVDHLFEVTGNNILYNTYTKKLKLIDFESNPLRYDEFRFKNNESYKMFINLRNRAKERLR